MDTLAKTTRFLAVLGGSLVVSVTGWMAPAAASPTGPILGGFSAQVCAGTVCTDLVADIDPTGALSANFNNTQISGLASFPELVFSGNVDPMIAGSFTLKNLTSVTQTLSVTATLGIVPIFGLQNALTDLSNGSCIDGGAEDFCSVAVVAPLAPWLADYQVDGGTTVGLPRGDGVTLPAPGGPYTDATFGTATGVFDCGVSGCSLLRYATTFTLTGLDQVQYDFQFSLTPAVAAEPGTWSLLGLSLASLGVLARRRDAS